MFTERKYSTGGRLYHTLQPLSVQVKSLHWYDAEGKKVGRPGKKSFWFIVIHLISLFQSNKHKHIIQLPFCCSIQLILL